VTSQVTLTETPTPTITSTPSTSSSIATPTRFTRLSTGTDGVIVTVTTIVGPDPSQSIASSDDGSRNGFLQNKAAMGATFGAWVSCFPFPASRFPERNAFNELTMLLRPAIAGLAVVVLGFLFITTCIRRRNAMKFDRDVAAAAAIAAAESQAVQPFDDDDDDDVFGGAPRARGGGYSYAPGKVRPHCVSAGMRFIPRVSCPRPHLTI
jgi:hypothetical protein